MTEASIFVFEDFVGGTEHSVGDPRCEAGWCGSSGFPHPCDRDGCGGLVHANFAEESWDGYSLYERCDVHDNQPDDAAQA